MSTFITPCQTTCKGFRFKILSLARGSPRGLKAISYTLTFFFRLLLSHCIYATRIFCGQIIYMPWIRQVRIFSERKWIVKSESTYKVSWWYNLSIFIVKSHMRFIIVSVFGSQELESPQILGSWSPEYYIDLKGLNSYEKISE